MQCENVPRLCGVVTAACDMMRLFTTYMAFHKKLIMLTN